MGGSEGGGGETEGGQRGRIRGGGSEGEDQSVCWGGGIRGGSEGVSGGRGQRRKIGGRGTHMLIYPSFHLPSSHPPILPSFHPPILPSFHPSILIAGRDRPSTRHLFICVAGIIRIRFRFDIIHIRFVITHNRVTIIHIRVDILWYVIRCIYGVLFCFSHCIVSRIFFFFLHLSFAVVCVLCYSVSNAVVTLLVMSL